MQASTAPSEEHPSIRPRRLERRRSLQLSQVFEAGFQTTGTRLRQVRGVREVRAKRKRRACLVGLRRSLASLCFGDVSISCCCSSRTPGFVGRRQGGIVVPGCTDGYLTARGALAVVAGGLEDSPMGGGSTSCPRRADVPGGCTWCGNIRRNVSRGEWRAVSVAFWLRFFAFSAVKHVLVGDSADRGQSDYTVNQAFLRNQRPGEYGVAPNQSLQPTANPLRGLSAAELGR